QVFPLVGGRLDYLHDRPLAALLYQRRKHSINLFIWPSTPGSDTATGLGTRQGCHLSQWTQSGITFRPVPAPTQREWGECVGLMLVSSGGCVSPHQPIDPVLIRPWTDPGYTVFAVVHGSQPRYTVPEIIQDMNRAVRFIRHHGKDYKIDAARVGIAGASAGG